mgnify:CR=1 FL=1
MPACTTANLLNAVCGNECGLGTCPFKNGNQIAELDESLVEVFYHDKIRIITTDQESLNEIFLMIVCLKIGEENEGGITFDFGNIRKMEPINENWKTEKTKY